jgi:hypothetical protein
MYLTSVDVRRRRRTVFDKARDRLEERTEAPGGAKLIGQTTERAANLT